MADDDKPDGAKSSGTNISIADTHAGEIAKAGAGVINKLFDVVSSAFDRRFADKIMARRAKGHASEIREIGAALKDVQDQGVQLTVKTDTIEATTNPNLAPPQQEAIELAHRTALRLSSEEMKRQTHLEAVIYHAADQFEGAQEPSTDPVDEDWATRFFNYAKDVSKDDMQQLWGKILAGEVARPGSFSLRTLEMIRQFSQADAKLFAVAARLVVEVGPFLFIPRDAKQLSLAKYGLKYPDVMHLASIGVITLNDAQMTTGENTSALLLRCGKSAVILEHELGVPIGQAFVYYLTESGRELMTLIEETTPPKEFLVDLCRTIGAKKGEEYYYFPDYRGGVVPIRMGLGEKLDV